MTARSRAIEQLRAAGKRVTPERELLLGILASNPHLDAMEIHRIAREEQPRISLATVYRTLGLFEKLGVVRACGLGEAHAHYEVRHDDHLHLVCSECGRIVDLPSPVPLREIAESEGFRIDRIRIELIGLCSACAKKRGAKSGKEG
jgi:Fe2+ or Zn2+ uptake regulation protein